MNFKPNVAPVGLSFNHLAQPFFSPPWSIFDQNDHAPVGLIHCKYMDKGGGFWEGEWQQSILARAGIVSGWKCF